MTTTNPTRLAVGLAAFAAERLRAGAPGGEVLATAVGLAEETGQAAREAAGRITGPPTRAAVRGARWASGLPGAALVRRPAQGARDRVGRTAAAARERGRTTVAAGRAQAVAVVSSSVDDAVSWLLPRLLHRALPEIRARMLPGVIEDLTAHPRVRDLLLEQNHSLINEAAEQLRRQAASPDEGVQSAFRRLAGGPFDAKPAPPGG